MRSISRQIFDQSLWQVSDLIRNPVRELIFNPPPDSYRAADRVAWETWDGIRDRVWVLHRPIYQQAKGDCNG
jgi:hypothetical protein